MEDLRQNPRNITLIIIIIIIIMVIKELENIHTDNQCRKPENLLFPSNVASVLNEVKIPRQK